MAKSSEIRASDADRERVAERLRHAATEGRLLSHEHEERLARAFRAQTYGELDAVVADLPSGRHDSAARGSAPRSRSRSRATLTQARKHPVAAVVLTLGVIASIAVMLAFAVVLFVLSMVVLILSGGRARQGHLVSRRVTRQALHRGGQVHVHMHRHTSRW